MSWCKISSICLVSALVLIVLISFSFEVFQSIVCLNIALSLGIIGTFSALICKEKIKSDYDRKD